MKMLLQRWPTVAKQGLHLSDYLAGRFVDYPDPRLTELLKGYSMQAALYHLIGG